MIDFSFTENQFAVRDMAKSLAERVIKPNTREFDRAQRLISDLLSPLAEANLSGSRPYPAN